MALTDKLTAIADAIRTKTGKTDGLTLEQMPAEIAGISGGAGVEECDVTLTGNNYFFGGAGFCYTTVGNDGEITSSDGRPSLVGPGTASGTFRCVKGSMLIVYKWNGMPATTYLAPTTGEITELVSVSTTGYTIIVFRVDGDGTITLT